MSELDNLSDDEASPEDDHSGEQQESASHHNGRHAKIAATARPTSTLNAHPAKTVQGRQTVNATKSILPAEKVFPIQVGAELFRLSGASITSDGPSYFTQFFEDQIRQNESTGGVRTLYIDRDPAIFRDIARHLQGYFIKPKNGEDFVKLFADAQFYNLPRLIEQLFESEIFIQIGDQHFQIPKDVFSDPGNSPNFFSLGFAVFFAAPGDVFPGLNKRGLLRPPPINPPYVPSRSATVFAQLLHLLRGYPLHIRDETHRAELLRDCRYFHLRGLEQHIIAHEISYNLERRKTEICLRLNDIKPSGILYQRDEDRTPSSSTGWVYYSRPFVDESPSELVVEIGGEEMELDLDEMRGDLHGTAQKRVGSLLQVVANKMNLPANVPLGLIMLSGASPSPASSPGFSSLSDDRIKVRFEPATSIVLDGEPLIVNWETTMGRMFSQGPTRAAPDLVSDWIGDDFSRRQPAITASTTTQKGSKKGASTNSRTSRSMAPSEGGSTVTTPTPPPPKRRKVDSDTSSLGTWVIRTGQWRLRVQSSQDPARSGYEVVFIGVKIDAFSEERARNMRRTFLG